MKKFVTVGAVDKKLGMTVPEILNALKVTKTVIPCANVTVSIGFNGRIKSITLTEKQENKEEV